MNARWNMSNASMADAQRIATLAVTQGGRYLDELWTLVEYALEERVRRFAYAQATRSATG